MKQFEKLRLKLNKELGLEIPEHATFRRTYAGYWQLSAGAWKWHCWWPERVCDIGSGFTVKEILEAKKISVGDGHYRNEIFVDE